MIERVRLREQPVRLPTRRPGAQSAEATKRYDRQAERFCALIVRIKSSLDFEVSNRGWCYILENRGIITKAEFSDAQKRIDEFRKDGRLPVDICIEDEARVAEHVEQLDDTTPEEEAEAIIDRAKLGHHFYNPISLWSDQDCFIQMAVEKGDLKSLFSNVCKTTTYRFST